MTAHFADRLLDAIDQKGSPVCVGIDPNLDYFPESLKADVSDPASVEEAVREFCHVVIKAVAPIVPAVKPQIAYFEALPLGDPFAGLKLYNETVATAQNAGLLVIGDAKRGDIGSTATAYAAAHLKNEPAVDALTVNAYFGADGLKPFIAAGEETGRGLFALVRTSNPTGRVVQNFQAADGTMFYEHMARQVAELGESCVGERGYSLLGAVVGATCPDEAKVLRKLMPQQIFLVPGYGAQGATAKDCAAAFKDDGAGAIVNSARAVIYAHQNKAYDGMDYPAAVTAAAEALANDIADALK